MTHWLESNPFASKIICEDCDKVFARKGRRAVQELTVRYGNAVNVTRSSERNIDKGLSDGLECIGGEPRSFYGGVDKVDAERKPIGRLSGREVHRIH